MFHWRCVRHDLLELRRQDLRKAIAIGFAGENSVHRFTQNEPTQPGDKAPVIIVRRVVVGQRGRIGKAQALAKLGQMRVVNHQGGGVGEALGQPALAGGAVAVLKLGLGVADDQNFITGRQGALNHRFVATVQRAKLAHHQAAAKWFAHSGVAPVLGPACALRCHHHHETRALTQ